MKVKECMSTQPEYIPPDITLHQAAELMSGDDIGFLPIGENDRLIGVVTDRDIAIRAVAEGKNPDKTTVRDIMTKNVFYCFDNDDLERAAETMEEQQVRRLIVLNKDKRMKGIISLGDLATKSKNEHLCCEVLERVSAEAA